MLTYMLAMVTNHIPYELIGDFGDTHIYSNHIAYVKEQLNRVPKSLPKIKFNRIVDDIRDFKFEDFKILGYESYTNWKNIPIAI